MADWTTGGTPTAEQRRHLAHPFDPSSFTTVLTGERDGFAWELRDGPHPLPRHDDAVGHELTTRGPRGNARSGATGLRLADDVHLDVGGSRAGDDETEIAMLTVRCGPEVATVRTRHVDGTTSEAAPVVSRSTGERWVVVALTGSTSVETVTALAADGTVLATRSPTDARIGAARPERPDPSVRPHPAERPDPTAPRDPAERPQARPAADHRMR